MKRRRKWGEGEVKGGAKRSRRPSYALHIELRLRYTIPIFEFGFRTKKVSVQSRHEI